MTKPEKYDFEYELMYMGQGGASRLQYPHYMYQEAKDPLLVQNTAEEADAKARGYDNITASAMANRHIINWYWDLEDMSAKQLSVFAMDEYGVDLPVEAGQNRLFAAVAELSKHAPQNRNRLVLMAHTIEMNYDATLAEIRRMAGGQGQDLEEETTQEEFFA